MFICVYVLFFYSFSFSSYWVVLYLILSLQSIAFQSVLWCIQWRKKWKKNTQNIEIEIEPQSAVPETGWFGKNEHYIASNFRNCLVKINEIEPIERINASNSTMFQQLHPQCNSRALNYFTQTLYNNHRKCRKVLLYTIAGCENYSAWLKLNAFWLSLL